MKKSPFDPSKQNVNLESKITVGLERISSVFRTLLWEYAKVNGLSPIQIQLLLFVAYHDDSLCRVSQLAHEFNLSKATISTAIKVMVQKELLKKVVSNLDRRAFAVTLTPAGKKIVGETKQFASPVESIVKSLPQKDKEQMNVTIQGLIHKLNTAGIILVQRNCFSCRFYEKNKNGHQCHFLNKKLLDFELRIDCPEFESP